MNLTEIKQQDQGLIVAAGRGTALASRDRKQYAHIHLKFHLGDQLALLPAHQVSEAVTIPVTSVTSMPNMHPAILGLINRRSQVMWVADLAVLLGLPTEPPTSQQYSLVVLQVNKTLIGLRVQAIDGILGIPPQQIYASPANIPARLMPFLRGCFLQNNTVLLVLNAETILRAPALQN